MENIALEAAQNENSESNVERRYILLHHCDIGDRSIHFALSGFTRQAVRDIAVYLQFKAERMFGEKTILSNLILVQYLGNFGAKIIEKTDGENLVGMNLIDMYYERESRLCGSNWFAENFDKFDLKYGEIASSFLKTKCKIVDHVNDEKPYLDSNKERKYILMHHYDIGDRSVHFGLSGFDSQEVRDLAVYLQFKVESLFSEQPCLDNITIAQFFESFGAEIIEKKDDYNPVGMFLIDMYSERESRLCGSNWYAENYDIFDLKYGEIATTFLQAKSANKDLANEMI